MEVKPLRYYDRSRTVTDWKCPRARYLQYEYDGRGIVNGTQALELFLGTAVHDGLAAIASDISIDVVAELQRTEFVQGLLTAGRDTEFASEQGSLVEGLLRGFHRAVWPRLMEGHEIIAVERELEYAHDGLVFMAKPDLVVRNLSDGSFWYIEYKTTSSKREAWINQWDTAIQLHSTIRAIEKTLGERVSGVIVQGLYKGYESYGKQNSPFCYAYQRYGTPPFGKTENIYEYRSGFKRFPTWELEGGVKAWVAGMPEEVLGDQFPCTPPIYVKDHMIDNFFAQRSVREHEILEGVKLFNETGDDHVLNTYFPQKFDQCQPGFGKPCDYRRICHGYVPDPLEQGFVLRQSHHAQEAAQHKEEDESSDSL